MVISSTRIQYPNYYNLHIRVSFCMSQRPSFLWCTYLEDSPTVHHLLSDMHEGKAIYKSIRHLCPYTMGTPLTRGTEPGAGKRETAPKRADLKWWTPLLRTVSSTELFLLVYVSWHGEGQSERKPAPGLLFFMLLISVIGTLLHLGSQVNYLLDIKVA